MDFVECMEIMKNETDCKLLTEMVNNKYISYVFKGVNIVINITDDYHVVARGISEEDGRKYFIFVSDDKLLTVDVEGGIVNRAVIVSAVYLHLLNYDLNAVWFADTYDLLTGLSVKMMRKKD